MIFNLYIKVNFSFELEWEKHPKTRKTRLRPQRPNHITYVHVWFIIANVFW